MFPSLAFIPIVKGIARVENTLRGHGEEDETYRRKQHALACNVMVSG
jgi:hypothetical protein